MSKISIANLKKTLYYLKRNGLRDTYLAALERLQQKQENGYTYVGEELGAELVSGETLTEKNKKFSILVPTYKTPEKLLRDMIDSVLAQSYENWELLLGDASEDDSVEQVVREYTDDRIRYLRLGENRGISENTNAVLAEATGDYTGLLDHDDLLTKDALLQMALAISQAKEKGIDLKLLYSDEDKCDETGEIFYEPHYKKEFNLDLILSNHYICHFTVLETALLKKLKFRKEYDGAQDHDVVLRAVKELLWDGERLGTDARAICHVPKVLYHWRCHRNSTAANPESKRYAYDAGGRAIKDFLESIGVEAQVSATKHLGFFQVEYEPNLLSARRDVGVVGWKILDKNNKITGGIYEEDGACPFEGMPDAFSGYMHRASLTQEACAVDVRAMRIREELFCVVADAVAAFTGQKGMVSMDGGCLDCSALSLSEQEYRSLSIQVCQAVREKGYRIVWMPRWRGADLRDVTVVIPNYNGLSYLKECLHSLREDVGEEKATVLVVDNGSEDGSVEYLREQSFVKLIALPENTGFCHAVNVGIKESKTPFVILLNNDTKVKGGFNKNLLLAIQQRESVFSVSAKMLDMKREELMDNAGDLYSALGWARARGQGKPAERFNKAANVFSACGGASIYRRSVFDEIGIFDEEHFAYLEDVDMGWRARIYGYINRYEPNAQVLHAGSAASGSKYNTFKTNLSSANNVYIIGKNMPLLQLLLNLPFLLVGFGIKWLFFVKKGMGGIYAKGCMRGLGRCFSKQGREKKVHFQVRYLGNYVKIQLELWRNLFMIQK